MKNKGFRTIPFPMSRVATFDVGKIGRKKHHICGLLEVDVTGARKKIRELKQSGKQLSFMSWFLKTTAQILMENPEAHGFLKNKKSLVIFDDVDISLPVERMVQGKAVPLMMVISKANQKSLSEIYQEIEQAKKQTIEDEADFVLNKGFSTLLMKLFYALPQCIRLLFWNSILKNPLAAQKNMGSVIVSSVNIGGPHPGWMIPRSMHNLCLGIGSIVKKPWVVRNRIEIREILHLTVLVDHDVIDGAPAARFVSQLLRALEKANYLE